MVHKTFWQLVALVLISATPAFAADAAINNGDTAWVIVSTALVMMMTPAGLALFYGGLARYKNLLNTYAMTFTAYCLASIVWVVYGYSLSFGPDKGGMIGGLDYFLLNGITVASIQGTIPQYVFVLFQMTFAG
ncbi:MAG: ammonium transporter, partial [Desulfatitalea sp.]|nr:ammonium transporter [Desulfatitalea sp.]